MTRWENIIRNGWFPKVTQCYQKRFPVDFRFKLAYWLEAQEQWLCSLDPMNPTHQPAIFNFLQQLLRQVEESPNQFPPVVPGNMESIMLNHRMQMAYQQLLDGLRHNINQVPFLVFDDIKLSLQEEIEVYRVLSCTTSPHQNVAVEAVPSEKERLEQVHQAMAQRINDLLGVKLLCLGVDIKSLDSTYLRLQESQNQQPYYIQATVAELKMKISHNSGIVTQLKEEIKELLGQVLLEVQSFKNDQRFVSLGKVQVRDLDRIDSLFYGVSSCLAEISTSIRILCYLCENLCKEQTNAMKAVQDEVEQMKMKMIYSCLVIEKQPKQVVRKQTFFGHPVTLRLLRCSDNMSILSCNEFLLYEDEAVRVANTPGHRPRKFAGTVTFKANTPPSKGNNRVQYKDLKISKVERTVRRGCSLVAEEKFFILFQCSIKVDGTTYDLSTVSIRLSVTSHPNQEVDAWAVILWENALETMRLQAGGPMKAVKSASPSPEDTSLVTWSSLIECIDCMFQNVGRGLSDKNKEYLKTKAFRGMPGDMLSWKQFSKDCFVEVDKELLEPKKEKEDPPKTTVEKTQKFTLWQWLYSALELLQWEPEDLKKVDQSLKTLWKQGKIEGFKSDDDIKSALLGAPNKGTFIIRFPEGRPTSIGVYVLDEEGRYLKLTYTKTDLEENSLHDRILKNIHLTHLYPNEPKQNFLKRSQGWEMINGYLKIELREYFSLASLRKSRGQSVDHYAPSPASSHSYHSITTRFTESPGTTNCQDGRRGSNSTTISECDTGTGTTNLLNFASLLECNETSFGDGSGSDGVMTWLDGVSPAVLTS